MTASSWAEVVFTAVDTSPGEVVRRRWREILDFSSRQAAEAQLRATNAFRDPREADDLGIRLVLP